MFLDTMLESGWLTCSALSRFILPSAARTGLFRWQMEFSPPNWRGLCSVLKSARLWTNYHSVGMNRSSSRIWHQRYILGLTYASYGQRSYIYVQPVKVVSSMGQQSVGKSFALNHLLDTSFAGSAMRTTGIVFIHVVTYTCAEISRGCMDVCNTYRRHAHRGARL